MSADRPSSVNEPQIATSTGSDIQMENHSGSMPWWVYSAFFALSIGIFVRVLIGDPERMRAGLMIAFMLLGATVFAALVFLFSRSGTLRLATYMGYAFVLIIVSISLSNLY